MPQVRPKPNYEWQVEEENRIQRLLETVTASLDAVQIPYAVIGGVAVATWVGTRDVGAIRTTKDLDILLNRTDLDLVEEALKPVGFVRGDVLGVPVFMHSDALLPSLGVHVILAGEKVRATSKYPAPGVSSVERTSSGYLVLNLLQLVSMKLEANRRHDQVHIEDLLRVGLIDAPLAAGLPGDLLERLRYVRDTMEWFTDPPVF